ncbi:MAG: GlsB/YeaQ/YmgE family stress response membrane protein [Rhodospirillales bacterium]|nr:MAG: GlsB/YeaQ/YmgE family stress response membrane protein [Rhodospirillales bacterium]
MTFTGFLIMPLVGAAMGWFAYQFMGIYPYGIIVNLIVGAVGAVVIGGILAALGFALIPGIIGGVVLSGIGAAVALGVMNFVYRYIRF